MIRFACLSLIAMVLFASCRSTRKIQTVVAPKDSTSVALPKGMSHEDSMKFISDTYHGIINNHIDFSSFSSKIEVDYEDGDGKKYDVTAHIRMLKDSVIWISVRAILGIEGLRAYITRDSVKLLDKQNNIYTARKVDQDNLNFSAVVFINGPWCIETGNPLLDRKSTSWSYLCFMSCR